MFSTYGRLLGSMDSAAPSRFYRYSAYLFRRYGVRTYRVSVDAGFACPNRARGREGAGCLYCDEDGSRAPYLGGEENLEHQIERSVGFLRGRYKAEKFVLYYQAYSGTYGTVEDLRRIYDVGLSAHDFTELVVATRPDCVDEERADLLASYRRSLDDVWVELGLQTPNEATLRAIRRGHGLGAFDEAFSLLRSRGIKVGVHLLFGLPGEDIDDVRRSAEFITAHHPDGVKIHNLRIVEGAPLFTLAARGETEILGWQRYVRYLVEFLPRIPEDVIILRLGFDPPRGRRKLPSWFPDKAGLYDRIEGSLAALDLKQGDLVEVAERLEPGQLKSGGNVARRGGDLRI